MTKFSHAPEPWIFEGPTIYALEHFGWHKSN